MMHMKHFLHKLRNVCAVICAGMVVLFFVWELALFIKVVFLHFSAEMAFATLKDIWGVNFLVLLFVALGNWLYVTDNDTKADFLGYCGLGGMVSFWVFGFALLAFGFAAYQFLTALGLFFASMYVGMGIFIITRYTTHKLRGLPLTYDEGELQYSKSGETALSV